MDTAIKIAKLVAIVMVAAFLGFAIWVIVPYHNAAPQLAHLAAKWADAAPSKGKIDSVAEKVSAAIPTAEQKDAVVKSATGVIQAANTVVSSAATVVSNAGTAINRTATNINRPCVGPAGPDACGTLAQANKVMVKVSDEIVQTQLQQRGVFPHVTDAMDSFKNAAGGLATDSTDIHDILISNQLQAAIAGFGTTATNVGKLSGDLYVYAHPILNPDPCKSTKCRFGRVFGTLSSMTGLGANGVRLYNAFEPAPVKVVH